MSSAVAEHCPGCRCGGAPPLDGLPPGLRRIADALCPAGTLVPTATLQMASECPSPSAFRNQLDRLRNHPALAGFALTHLADGETSGYALLRLEG